MKESNNKTTPYYGLPTWRSGPKIVVFFMILIILFVVPFGYKIIGQREIASIYNFQAQAIEKGIWVKVTFYLADAEGNLIPNIVNDKRIYIYLVDHRGYHLPIFMRPVNVNFSMADLDNLRDTFNRHPKQYQYFFSIDEHRFSLLISRKNNIQDTIMYGKSVFAEGHILVRVVTEDLRGRDTILTAEYPLAMLYSSEEAMKIIEQIIK